MAFVRRSLRDEQQGEQYFQTIITDSQPGGPVIMNDEPYAASGAGREMSAATAASRIPLARTVCLSCPASRNALSVVDCGDSASLGVAVVVELPADVGHAPNGAFHSCFFFRDEKE